MFQNLTQPELGILYVEMAAPLRFQQAVNKRNMTEEDSLALHQIFGDQKPDTALIGLALCGVMLANILLESTMVSKETTILATELKYFSIDIVERYGRAWINAKEYDAPIDEVEAQELLWESPENLNAFGSIIQEVMEEIKEEESEASLGLGYVLHACQILEYQSYAQANIAESYVDMMQADLEEGVDSVPLPKDFQE